MKFVVGNSQGEMKVLDLPFCPRVGDKIDVFHEPLPIVKEVILSPRKERLQKLHIDDKNVAAIIVVD